MPYALFKGNTRVSKIHSTKEAVVVEAFEAGHVVMCKRRNYLRTDMDILEVTENEHNNKTKLA